MSDDREPGDPAANSRPGAGPGTDRAAEGRERPPGPLESLFQEAVRRATGIGVSGLAATEEAMRRAFNERAPREWVDFLNSQGEELRGEILDRLATEFADYLRSGELTKVLRKLLDDYELSIQVRLRADSRATAEEPRVELRRRGD